MTHYVYLYRDPKDDTPRYVGKGSGERLKCHIKKSHNTQLDRMIQKRIRSGFEITPEIICGGFATHRSALAAELFWVAVLGRVCKTPEGTLFNASPGGLGGTDKGRVTKPRTITEKVLTGYKKIGAALKDRPLAAETVVKRTESRLQKYDGKYCSPETYDQAYRDMVKRTWETRRAKYGPSGRNSKEST